MAVLGFLLRQDLALVISLVHVLSSELISRLSSLGLARCSHQKRSAQLHRQRLLKLDC